MRKALTFSALASLLALQGCMGPKPGSPEAKALVIQEMQEQKAEAVEDTVSEIPGWCIEPPKSNVATFACGSGLSMNLNIARTRALLDAKRQIADVFYGDISTKVKEFVSSTGSENNEEVLQKITTATQNTIVQAKLIGYSQKETETQAIGTKYRHYILLEYPHGAANNAFMDELRKSEILRTDQAAQRALAELEAEINKRQNN